MAVIPKTRVLSRRLAYGRSQLPQLKVNGKSFLSPELPGASLLTSSARPIFLTHCLRRNTTHEHMVSMFSWGSRSKLTYACHRSV